MQENVENMKDQFTSRKICESSSETPRGILPYLGNISLCLCAYVCDILRTLRNKRIINKLLYDINTCLSRFIVDYIPRRTSISS